MSVAAMTRSVALLLVSASWLSLAVSAARAPEQQPVPAFPVQPRDGAPGSHPVTGTSTVRGVVTSAGQPVADARVMISGGRAGPPRSAVTDDRGRFTVASLPAGQYTINASKAGHVNVSWGQRRYGGMGRPLHLRDGETREVALELPRAGVITGMVVTERGEPAIGTHVQALQFTFMNGQRVPRPTGGSSTDDRGLYRIHSLQPGEYVVCATPRNQDATNERMMLRRNLEMMRQGPANPAMVPEAARQQMAERIAHLEAQLAVAADEPVRGYAPICVPGPAVGYGTITIAPGEERSAVDLQMERIVLASLEGRLVLPPGVSPRNVMVTVVRPGDMTWMGGGPQPMLEETGRFVRDALVPGEYRVEARTRSISPGGVMVFGGPAPPPPAPPAADQVPKFWAAANVVVEAGNTTELVLDLQPAFSISGEIVFEGSSRVAADLSRMEIVASPVVPPAFGPMMMAEPARGTADAAGRFVISGVFPGTYRLSTGMPGWSAKSIVLGDQDVLDMPLDIDGSRQLTGVVVTLTDRTQELSGTIVDGRGAPASDHSLILFPSDERLWTPMSRRMRLSRPEPDGTFVFRGIPAGDYRVATVLDVEQGAWNNPDFLRELVWTSTRVLIGEGEKKAVALRVAAEP
jgi:hypothetical protein